MEAPEGSWRRPLEAPEAPGGFLEVLEFLLCFEVVRKPPPRIYPRKIQPPPCRAWLYFIRDLGLRSLQAPPETSQGPPGSGAWASRPLDLQGPPGSQVAGFTALQKFQARGCRRLDLQARVSKGLQEPSTPSRRLRSPPGLQKSRGKGCNRRLSFENLQGPWASSPPTTSKPLTQQQPEGC